VPDLASLKDEAYRGNNVFTPLRKERFGVV
jgi:hypothetical protein